MKISLDLLEKILNDATNYHAYEGGAGEIDIIIETPGWFIASQKNENENVSPVIRKYDKGDNHDKKN